MVERQRSLPVKSKVLVRICVLYRIVNCYLHAQYIALQKSVKQVYGAGVIEEVSSVQLLHMFWSIQEALDEYFKDTWVRVNPYYPMNFMSDITKEQNKDFDSDNRMIKVQVCNVGTLQKPLLTRWWHFNTCYAQVVCYFNLQK